MDQDQAPKSAAQLTGKQEELDWIRGMVKRFGRGTWDEDELVSNIWWECWIKKRPVSVVMVKRRIWDRYKKTKRREEILRTIARPEPEVDQDPGPGPDVVVRKLLALAMVRGVEKQMLWMRFVEGRSVDQIARELGMSGKEVMVTLNSVIGRIKLAKGELDGTQED
jgi:DNA-directed RNA polymerase specialized sigma24 family protein